MGQHDLRAVFVGSGGAAIAGIAAMRNHGHFLAITNLQDLRATSSTLRGSSTRGVAPR